MGVKSKSPCRMGVKSKVGYTYNAWNQYCTLWHILPGTSEAPDPCILDWLRWLLIIAPLGTFMCLSDSILYL